MDALFVRLTRRMEKGLFRWKRRLCRENARQKVSAQLREPRTPFPRYVARAAARALIRVNAPLLVA